MIKCVELASLDWSAIDTIFFLDCQMQALVNAWFHNPLPFPITLASLQYSVYFRDLDGFGCTLLGCIYDPVPDYFFTNVS